MKHQSHNRIAEKKTRGIVISNFTLRFSSLGLRFFLLFFIARDFPTTELGIWGIITTSVALAIYLVGLDFYTFSSREILQYPEHERLPYLRDQFIFYLLNYVLIFPLLGILFLANFIALQYMLIFYILVLLEHLSQEAFRTLVLFSRQLEANIVLFFRSGFWVIVLMILWFCNVPGIRTLAAVFYFWIGGLLLSIAIALYYFGKIHFTPVGNKKINWQWIKKGTLVSGLFFMGTAGYKVIDFADRYFIQHYRSVSEAGIYIFYGNICNVIETVLYTVTIIMLSPGLITSFNNQPDQYQIKFGTFRKQIVRFTLLCAAALLLFTYPVIIYLNKTEIAEQFPAFIILVAGKILFNISLIFHYALYVRKADSVLIFSTVFSALVNVVLNILLIPHYGITGAAIATFLSLLILTILKILASRNFPEIQIIFGTQKKK